MGLYERIRDTAKEKGYSVNRLEKELNFPRSSINKFNKNNPGADKIQKIADLLGVSADYLITGKSPDEDEVQKIDAKTRRLMAYAEELLDMGIDEEFLKSLMETFKKKDR